MFIGQFLKGNKIEPQNIQNGRNYAHAQLLNAYNFIGRFLKGDSMGPIKIHNGGN